MAADKIAVRREDIAAIATLTAQQTNLQNDVAEVKTDIANVKKDTSRLPLEMVNLRAGVANVESAIATIGRALDTYTEQDIRGREEIKDSLLEIKTDIKLINARHRALKRKVAVIGAAVGALVTGAGHYVVDLWHLIFPASSGK